MADFLSAPQVRRERAGAVAQTAEVDQAPDSSLARGPSEIVGRPTVLRLECSGRSHGVDEVVGRMHVLERSIQRGRIQDIAGDHFSMRPNP